jgi:hypothetical protein
VIHADSSSLNQRWRTLISAAVADGAIGPDVDPRLLRHVLYRVTTQAGLVAWARQSNAGRRDVADCISAIIFDGLASTPPSYDDESVVIAVVNETAQQRATDAAALVTRPLASFPITPASLVSISSGNSTNGMPTHLHRAGRCPRRGAAQAGLRSAL